MTKLFYPLTPGVGFSIHNFFRIEKHQFEPDVKTFPRGIFIGDSDLEMENRDNCNQPLLNPWVAEHLARDSTSSLLIYCGSETIGNDQLINRIGRLQSMGIGRDQLHFISASTAQNANIAEVMPGLKTSAFYHWEMYCAVKTQTWHEEVEPKTQFLYLNRRNSHERLYLAYLLLNQHRLQHTMEYSLHPGIYWTQHTRTEQLNHYKQVLQCIPEQHRTNISRWCLTNPWRSIPSPERSEPFKYTLFDSHMEQLIKQSALSIVTESHPYHPQYCFMPTEKIMRTIGADRAFVVLGTQHYLKHLRSMGYKTFSDYWSEDYDSEPDLYRRIEMVRDTVLEIAAMDPLTIIKLTREVCEHNRQTLRARTEAASVAQDFDSELRPYIQFAKPQLPIEVY